MKICVKDIFQTKSHSQKKKLPPVLTHKTKYDDSELRNHDSKISDSEPEFFPKSDFFDYQKEDYLIKQVLASVPQKKKKISRYTIPNISKNKLNNEINIDSFLSKRPNSSFFPPPQEIPSAIAFEVLPKGWKSNTTKRRYDLGLKTFVHDDMLPQI